MATPSAIHHVAIIASALATFRPYHALAFLPFTLSPSNDDHHPRRQFRRPIYPFVKISRLRLDFIGNSSATMTTTTTADNVGIIYCRRFLITLVIDCETSRDENYVSIVWRCRNLCRFNVSVNSKFITTGLSRVNINNSSNQSSYTILEIFVEY